MKKVLNWMSFLASLLKAFADGGKNVLPAYDELIKANASDKLMDEKNIKL